MHMPVPLVCVVVVLTVVLDTVVVRAVVVVVVPAVVLVVVPAVVVVVVLAVVVVVVPAAVVVVAVDACRSTQSDTVIPCTHSILHYFYRHFWSNKFMKLLVSYILETVCPKAFSTVDFFRNI